MIKSLTFVAASIILCMPCSAAVSVSLNIPASSVQLGETILITATASDSSNSNATFRYRFSVSPDGGNTYYIQRDFYQYNSIHWTPFYYEGSRVIEVCVEEYPSVSATCTTGTILVTSRVTGSSPVVNTTNNTLVAIYSAPPCASGNEMWVQFQPSGATTWQVTPSQACDGVHSVNFYIGGMYQNTKYTLQQVLSNGSQPGPLTFTTGSVPGSVSISPPSIIQTAPSSDTTDPFEIRCTSVAYATDLNENIVWYGPPNLGHGYLVRPVPGGTFLGIRDGDNPGDQMFLDEFDMAGNVIRETNWVVLQQEINYYRASCPPTTNNCASGTNVTLDFISHEGNRLPDGTTLMMVSQERVVNNAAQGSGPTDVLGDIILVIGPNFQLRWAWNSFDWLSLDRPALQNNKCTPGSPGCPLYLFNTNPNTGKTYTVANDWTHANSIAMDPSDGNLIISLRHQAWVIKVEYNNGSGPGTGDGHIIWTLGNPDVSGFPPPTSPYFTLANPSTDYWFDFQHDVEFQSNGLLTLFDNNNLGWGGSDSRGQAWSLDQTHLIATPVVNIDLGVFSGAVGAAEYLPNGDYWFDAGFIIGPNGPESKSFEFTPSGTLVFEDQEPGFMYRTFRLPSMYDE